MFESLREFGQPN